ncbi:MAG: hypothetical protein AABX93_02195 [Nanoarchaeota archaeon]
MIPFLVGIAASSIATKVFPSILKFGIAAFKSTLGKTALVAGASLPITYVAGKSIGNLSSAFGINKEKNALTEIERLTAEKELLQASKSADAEAINAVKRDSASGMGLKEWLILGGLVAIAGLGVYYIGRKK